ncbi:MAG: hypothetical protein K8L99_32065 [Anaerolineae bacterium]|nr:hypothetical protein [Anaerolineae bacterium]
MFRLTAFYLFLLLLLSPLPVVHATEAVVTDCTTYGPGSGTLEDALATGDTITFACSGTIIVPLITIATSTTIDATGQTVILSGNDSNPIFSLYGIDEWTVTLTLINLTLTDGYTPGSGGAIIVRWNKLVLQDTFIRDSYAAEHGGAVSVIKGVYGGGGVDMIGGGLINNSAGNQGGAIATDYGYIRVKHTVIDHNSALYGGAFYADGFIRATDSTFSNNEANKGGAIYNFAFWGGGIVEITNSTFSNNRAVGENSQGGALFQNVSDNQYYIFSSTFYGNSADEGGTVYSASASTVYLINSLIAASTGDDCAGKPHHYVSRNSLATGLCGTEAPTGIDPVLQDNGGPTMTHALLEGSNAIDANAVCPPFFADQRGMVRPADGDGDGQEVCDIGAYEYGTASGAPLRNHFTAPDYDPITLTWGAVDWAIAYEIEISRTPDFSDVIKNSVATADTLELQLNSGPDGINKNGPYYWHVRAQRPDQSWGEWSATDSFIVDVNSRYWFF